MKKEVDFSFETRDNRALLEIKGRLIKHTIKSIYPQIKRLKSTQTRSLVIELKELKELDFAGALIISNIITHFSKEGSSIIVK